MHRLRIFANSSLDKPETPGAAILSAIFPHRRKDRVYGLQPPLLSKKIVKLVNFNHGQATLFGGWKQGTHGDLGRYTELAYKPWDGKPAMVVYFHDDHPTNN